MSLVVESYSDGIVSFQAMMAFTSSMFLLVKAAICSGVSPLLCIFRTILVSAVASPSALPRAELLEI